MMGRCASRSLGGFSGSTDNDRAARQAAFEKDQGSKCERAALFVEPKERLMTLSNAFKRIRMHLARSGDFPAGSRRHGYELVVPLDRSGHIDVDLWKAQRQHCRVQRFWAGEADQQGYLVHKPGGQDHARWVFDYDAADTDDDEVGVRFGAHVFVPGEYVTIRDGRSDHTFQIDSVENAV